MKNKHITVLLLVHLLLAQSFANAQSPNAFPYQGVARNSSGNILASQPIMMRISIHDVIPTGTVVYSETHAVTTTSLGLFSVNIGQGAIISGTFAAVNWSTGAKYRQVELDPNPPSSYIDMGTVQFNSVPYALYANTFQAGTAAGQMLYWNGNAWVTIPSGVPGQELTYSNNGPVWQTTDTVTLTTAPVSNIEGTSVACGGNIIGSATPVTARGVCWSTLPNPTTANNFTTDGLGYGSFVSNPTGLTLNTTYYMRAYATNGSVTSYGNEISFTTFITTIGQPYQGGILAYFLKSGDPGYDANVQHGLIAAPSDQSAGMAWGCQGVNISGADGTALGTGNQNTIDIMNYTCPVAYEAARLCGNLVLGGYSDWYLPSIDELNKLLLNSGAIGGFAGYYWSSSEYNDGDAWYSSTWPGQAHFYKQWLGPRVRAVRTF